MSQYISTEDGEQDQCASNVGWSDFCDWVNTLLIDDYPSLHHLCQFGYENDPEVCADELTGAIEHQTPEDDTVRTTAEGLLSWVKAHAKAEIIIVGDGITE